MIRFNKNTSPLGELLGKEPAPLVHDFHGLGLCSESGLHELLTTTPRECLKAKTASQQRQERFSTQNISRHKVLELFEKTEEDMWIVLHEIEHNPILIPLFREMASFLKENLPPYFGNIRLCTGSIFISRGTASTPYHLDYGSNILLQLCGNKHFLAFSPNDPELVPKQALKEFFKGDATPPSLIYSPAFEKKALMLDLKPGDGIYMPSTSPHCTDTQGSQVSVTLSLSFIAPVAEHLRRTNLFDSKFPHLAFVPGWVKQGLLACYEPLRQGFGGRQPQHKSFKPDVFQSK
ncbi:cupin-like domain-containing protein [Marinobacter zhejiangensis]|uniref:Cupin-like domain-containing protein n=1 Tax=Marinobacter zhejiangensis TaxID=488535 RepID=A0A1I4RNK4_9GAMM|nr:cupin-like domain-containing protein [Marinobacter zhejiangensis]SFM53818.1 Cupin-like domain-containing protein [Marinobacter zhejiangensis]